MSSMSILRRRADCEGSLYSIVVRGASRMTGMLRLTSCVIYLTIAWISASFKLILARSSMLSSMANFRIW